jgi:hypothetical protein
VSTSGTIKNNLVFQSPIYDISLRNGLKATGMISSNPLFKAYSHTADLDGKPRKASTGDDLGACQH